MHTTATPSLFAATLFRVASLMHAAARRVRALAWRLDERAQSRRTTLSRHTESASASMHELFDIGLTGAGLTYGEWPSWRAAPRAGADRHDPRAADPAAEHGLLKASFFLYGGFVGLGVLAAGAGALFDPPVHWLTTVALLAGGAALVVASWSRARKLLPSDMDGEA